MNSYQIPNIGTRLMDIDIGIHKEIKELRKVIAKLSRRVRRLEHELARKRDSER